MTDSGTFYHALTILSDVCIGCTHCMKVCPTEAIRVSHGKATLFENRCVDCGECFRSCPVCAIIIEQDDFEKIYEYPVRVALVPSVFIGQFPEEINTDEIFSELLELGFTHVFEVEHGVEILLGEVNEYVRSHDEKKPIISPYCPAIVRLIQVKFPALVEHIMLLKPPVDIAAMYNKKKYLDQGFDAKDIGLFYITPCAAKIAAVKSPVGEDFSEVTGVINMNFLYNKVLTRIRHLKKDTCLVPARDSLQEQCIVWSLTRGESVNFFGRSIAIDGIHNVIAFLEKIENEDDLEIDFLELRACDESCAGGVLTAGNPFLTAERLHNRAYLAGKKVMKGLQPRQTIMDYLDYLIDRLQIGKIKPRSMMKLDEDLTEAMRKMKRVHELMIYLPQVDCGSCGSPSCAALAEDIVQHRGNITQCIFVQRILEDRKIFTSGESLRIFKNIWGNDKFDRKWQINL